MSHLTSASALFCREALPAVSRTFALNIPVLPPPLDMAVTVAYLLCRVADTLEDEVQGPAVEALLEELARLSRLPPGWEEDTRRFSGQAVRSLRAEAPVAEVRLVEQVHPVLEVLASLPQEVRGPVAGCLETMTRGMGRMGAKGRAAGGGLGLNNLGETLEYCYYVAGTVGEMLTRLFAWHSPSVARRLPRLESQAIAFGNALQLTNILKDVREDLERGSCWLPRTLMDEHGLRPEELLEPRHRAEAQRLHSRMVAVAHGELRKALAYTLALPRRERGLRLFCLWPLFLSVMTLRRIHGNPAVWEPQPVKVSRNTVRWVVVGTRLLASSNGALRLLFSWLSRPLPPPELEESSLSGEALASLGLVTSSTSGQEPA